MAQETNRPHAVSPAQSETSRDTFVRGSAWITAGSVFSRILGAVYIMAWLPMIGNAETGNLANALYGKGYNIYSIFLMISTAGIPGAIAKQVAHYNTLNEYRIGQQLFKTGVRIMAILGVVSAAIMYFAAPLYAQSPEEIPVYHALSWAVLIIPFLSIFRGYFQGFSEMAPSAISQVVEQLARVAYLLGATFVIMKINHGHYQEAVVQSTFAAFIGALFGILVLVWFYLRQRPKINRLVAQSDNEIRVSPRGLVIDILRQALPFILIGSGITIFQLIDQYTFFRMLPKFFIVTKKQMEIYFGIFNFNSNKLVMIVISFAAALAVAAVPLLSAAYARKDRRDMSAQITNILQLFLIIMVPSAFGVAAVAAPLYTLFYGYDALGISVLHLNAFTAILSGLFTVLAAVMQGLYQNKRAMGYLVVGIATKLILQYPMIAFFNVYGPLVSTGLGMLVTCLLMLGSLLRTYGFRVKQTARRMMGILAFSVLMYLLTATAVNLLSLVMNPERKIYAAVILIIAVVIGIAVYGYLILRTRLADRIIGNRISGLRRRLHIK
ncbi:oligosaccharide flippase family protein [Lapidilactobacillus achengensis]|uniref:Oligosaccharide flippase family protein n=1 Tax=Lapidilactobacillus achengensis TaxID=2486000 RepID=A0ABW1UTL7_9LACO|nr:polysaccharide biosynthesis protein [Lapidilactobacillus achengensis]